MFTLLADPVIAKQKKQKQTSILFFTWGLSGLVRQDMGWLAGEGEGMELLLALTLFISLCHVTRQPVQKKLFVKIDDERATSFSGWSVHDKQKKRPESSQLNDRNQWTSHCIAWVISFFYLYFFECILKDFDNN